MKPIKKLILIASCVAGSTLNSNAQTWNTAGNAAASADFIGTTNSNSLKFKTKNTLRMTIDTTGKVGIGLANPSSLLQLSGTDTVSLSTHGKFLIGYVNAPNLVADENDIQSRSNGSSALLRLNKLGGDVQMGDGSNGFYFKQTGLLGLGTSAPAARLHINVGSAATSSTGGYAIMGTTTSANLAIDQDGLQARSNSLAAPLVLNSYGGDIKFGLTSQNNILKTSNGYLGLGTLTPSSILHLGTGTQISLASGGYETVGATATQNIAIDPDDIQARNNGSASTLYLNYYGGDISHGTAANTFIYKAATGFLGIGKSTPLSKMDVYRGRLRFSGQVNAGTASGIEFTDTTGTTLRGFMGMYDNNNMALWGFGGAGWNFKMNVNDGRISIGQNINPATGYMLAVDGGIICEELKVQMSPFPDYVFAKDYKLRSLQEVEDHIREFNRLPGMPAATVVDKEGMNVGEMSTKLVEKVEELTLYVIQLQKEIEQLKASKN